MPWKRLWPEEREPLSPARRPNYWSPALASELGGSDCTLVRLLGASGELVGVLCLEVASSPYPMGTSRFCKPIAGHAAVALENARLLHADGPSRTRHCGRNLRCHQRLHSVAHDESAMYGEPASLAMSIHRSRPPSPHRGVNRCLLCCAWATLLRCAPALSAEYTGDGDDEYVHPCWSVTVFGFQFARVHGASSEGDGRSSMLLKAY